MRRLHIGVEARHDPGRGWSAWLPGSAVAPPARALIRGHGSLTQAVRGVSRDFSVRVTTAGLAPPFVDERAALGMRRPVIGWVREVLLCDADTPLVFAHTVLRRDDLVGWPWLTGLGGKPLGEVLFRHPRVHRLPLSFRRIDARHPLYHSARRAAGGAAPWLWARRSLFSLDGRRLLVTEVFLPALLERLTHP